MSNRDDDLSGFSELLDNKKQAPKRKTSSSSKVETYELLTFIEDETNRLSKLCDFFDSKLKNSVQYSQTDEVIKRQNQHNRRLKDKLKNELEGKDSEFTKNLAHLFDSHFKEI
jgi:hypothetical protein